MPLHLFHRSDFRLSNFLFAESIFDEPFFRLCSSRSSLERSKREKNWRIVFTRRAMSRRPTYFLINAGLRNELEARCTDSASVSPMCLTCDVKVAGTGAYKAVLNICQASSAPRFEEECLGFVFRSTWNPPSSRSFVIRSRRKVKCKNFSLRLKLSIEIFRKIYFLATFYLNF